MEYRENGRAYVPAEAGASTKRGRPFPGERYRHFKGGLYQIVANAVHTETGEPMVVYQALYGDFAVWVRPLSMFLGETDREKYPEAEQKYRFERVNGPAPEAAGRAAREAVPTENIQETGLPEVPAPRRALMDFFDAADGKQYDRMLEMLAKMAERITQKELDDIGTVLDLEPGRGDLDAQLLAIRRHILMLKKFDGDRLR